MCLLTPLVVVAVAVSSGLHVGELRQVGVEEILEETPDGRLGRGAPGGAEGQVQHLGGVEGCGAGLGGVEALHGAGQPDQPLQALDVAAAVVHQLVLGHRPAAAVGKEQEPLSNNNNNSNREAKQEATGGNAPTDRLASSADRSCKVLPLSGIETLRLCEI